MLSVAWPISSVLSPLLGGKDTGARYTAQPAYTPDNRPPPRSFSYKIHPLEPQMTKEVNGYFLKHWPFENEKARKKFVAAAFSEVTCLYFPLARNDRIKFACELLTILFLIDGKHRRHLV
jgi:aristolochene synthase